jgi:hypothetical protein
MRLKSFGNIVVIAIALFVGAMALTPNVAMAKERPYKATMEYLAMGFPDGIYAGSGNATHLGRTTESGSYTVVEFVGPGLAHLTGEGTQVAANGDTLSYTFDEIVDFNVEPFTAVGSFTITGGTGRFEGATGGGSFDTIGVFLRSGALGLSIEYEGKIDY